MILETTVQSTLTSGATCVGAIDMVKPSNVVVLVQEVDTDMRYPTTWFRDILRQCNAGCRNR